MKGQS